MGFILEISVFEACLWAGECPWACLCRSAWGWSVGRGSGVMAVLRGVGGIWGEAGVGAAVAAVWFLEVGGLGAGLCFHRNLGFFKYFLVS